MTVGVADLSEEVLLTPPPAVVRAPFRSWVDDWSPDRGWKFNAQAVAKANTQRATFKNRAQRAPTRAGDVTRKIQADSALAREEQRRACPFEQAKSFLARTVPVYSAAVIGGSARITIVGHQRLTRVAVFKLARANGWQG